MRNKLLKLTMEVYDKQSFRNDIARKLVHDLMRDGLQNMSDELVAKTAHRWFPDKFPEVS
jgi:hypothetical protein